MNSKKYLEQTTKTKDCHLGRVTLNNLKKWKNLVHQVELSSDEVESHEDVRIRSVRVAQALKTRGVGVGDTVILCSDTHNNACIPIIASFYIGSATFPMSKTMKLAEIKRFISLSCPKIIFCDLYMRDTFTKALDELNLDVEIVIFGDAPKHLKSTQRITAFSELLTPTGTEDSFEVTDFDPSSTLSLILCSSGTTGLPKGVCLSHTFFASSLYLLKESGYKTGSGFYMNFSNYFWISAIWSLCITCLFNMPRLICALPFSVELVQKGLKKYPPHTILLNPVVLYEVIKHPLFNDMDFSSVEVFFVGGMPVSETLRKIMLKRIPAGSLHVAYGSTEASFVSILNEKDNPSVGKALPFIDWKVVNIETGQRVNIGECGELCIKTPSIFKCYLKNPEATSEAFDNENYFKTGDMFTHDEEGFLYFKDRVKEVLKYRGFQVTPAEIEIEVRKLEDVVQVCVVGRKNEDNGELPVAFIQKKKCSNITAQDIHDIISNLSDHCQLRGGVVFLEEIPQTTSGKINRFALKEMAQILAGEAVKI